jgi:hypothetical protein
VINTIYKSIDPNMVLIYWHYWLYI